MLVRVVMTATAATGLSCVVSIEYNTLCGALSSSDISVS